MSGTYADFLDRKRHISGDHGFDPAFMPDWLFPFQRDLVTWAARKGRAAIFADCGMGKTPMQLVWAENVVRHTGKRVLIVAPLAVSHQTIREGEKFGIEVRRSDDGTSYPGITITNYERIDKFNSADFIGTVCDESSAIKAFHGKRREAVTEFMAKQPYRLLATATAAPNDFVELGTSAEALGVMNRTDVLDRFFVNDDGTSLYARKKWTGQQQKIEQGWRFKGHAEDPFWRWVASWARALRKPSDYGYPDDGFILPSLSREDHTVEARRLREGMLFELDAIGLGEEREEMRRTIGERCEHVASLVNGTGAPAVVWCHLNDEGDLLERLIPDAVQVAGRHSDEHKEQTAVDFAEGRTRVIISKPKIFGFGLNWQHCAHMTFFPSHSYESYYQAVRRCWRFGQASPVHVDVVSTKGGHAIMRNLERKAAQADRMFTALVASMNDAMSITIDRNTTDKEIPSWLQPINA